jgi:hypothetical protein
LLIYKKNAQLNAQLTEILPSSVIMVTGGKRAAPHFDIAITCKTIHILI